MFLFIEFDGFGQPIDINVTIDFMIVLFEAEDAVFQFDEEKRIYLFGWKGIVSLESVTEVLTLASKISEDLKDVHWLIDRRALEGYTAEARIWIKDDFVNTVGKDLILKIDKIAALESTSPMANLSSAVLTKSIMKVNPNIDAQLFDYIQPASNWLAGIVPEVVEKKPSKVRSLFTRKKK